MKKIKFLILFLFFSSAIIFAQQKKYVSYSVKKGETIKSIAKRYDLSKRDLLRLNPGVRKKPKANTVIIVPNKNYGKKVVIVVKDDSNLYTVKPKETLYSISKKNGITIEELKAANPALKNGMKIGMKLTIPKASKVDAANDLENFLTRTVVVDDTVYNLTKRYDISENELRSLNPLLKDGLKLGMILKIKPVETTSEITEEENTESFVENIDFDKALNVVFMLPYQLNKQNDSVTKAGFIKSNSLLNFTTDFHLGAKMAIDSLKQKGIHINAKFLDTENSNIKIKYLLSINDLNSADVVIGPLYYDKAYAVAKRLNVPVIAPFYSKKQKKLTTGNLVKSSPDLDAYEEKLLNYMSETYNGENIVVINDEKPENQSKLWRIVNKLKSFDSIQKISVVKPVKGVIDSKLFTQKLDTLDKNWVFILSNERVTTSAAINNLKSYVEDVDIKLFALNKGRNFNNINNSFLGKLSFVYATSEFIYGNDIKVKRFYEKYKSRNYSLPTKNAIRGFDITYDALIRLASNESLEDGLSDGKSMRISSGFNYSKKLFSNFENSNVFLIQYSEDLNTTIIK